MLFYRECFLRRPSKNLESIPDSPLLAGVEEILSEQFLYLQAQEEDARSLLMADVAGITLSTASTVGSTAIFLNKNLIKPMPVFATLASNKNQEYIAKFSELNPELGRSYASVMEIFYGSIESPEKAALYAMRQTYDHFFRILAPDQDVKASQSYSEKTGADVGKVFRMERIRYAASTRIKDTRIKDLLIADSKQLLEVYEKLNKMHSGEELNRGAVREHLTAMKLILEKWADAIGL